MLCWLEGKSCWSVFLIVMCGESPQLYNNSVSDLDRFTVVDKSSVNSSESVILGIKIEGIQRLRQSKQDDREL